MAAGGKSATVARRLAGGLATVTVTTGVVMATTGWGTGEGPLGPADTQAGVGLSRDVGASFTEGNLMLVNDGRFDVHIEAIRPVPRGGAALGMPLTALALSRPQPGGVAVGVVEGSGDGAVPASGRYAAAGFVLHPAREVGEHRARAEILATYRIAKPGAWSYEGYEVVYRSGLVRHRLVAYLAVAGCTPSGAPCEPSIHE